MSRTVTAPARTFAVSLDGGPFAPVPFGPRDFTCAGDFARCVVASLVWAATGEAPRFDHVASCRTGYVGAFNVGTGRRARAVRFAVTLAPAPVMVPQLAQQPQAKARPAHVAPAARAALAPTRTAPARDAAPGIAHRAVVGAPVVACIDGAAEPCGRVALATAAARHTFAATVLASLVCLATGAAQADVVSIEPAGLGCYVADFACLADDGELYGYPVVFGLADGEPTDAPAPVSAEPAPDARPVKRLPAPAVAAALKAGSAAVKAAADIVRVRVTLTNAGSFDVHASRAELSKPADFARLYVAPRAAQYHEWVRCNVECASAIGTDSYLASVSNGASRQDAVWGPVGPDVAPPAVALPLRRGMGGARPATPADVLAARMGRAPAGAAVAAAEAKAAAAGVKLSRADRATADAIDAAAARQAQPGRTPAGHAVEAQPRYSAASRATLEAAAKGVLPTPPDFTAPTHERYRGKLAELVKLAKAGDVAGLRGYVINAISTSPKALNRYRNACVVALEARAARRAAKAAAAA